MHMVAMGAVISIFAGCAVQAGDQGEAVDATQDPLRIRCDIDCPDTSGTSSGSITSSGGTTTSSSSSSSSSGTYTPPTPITGQPQGLTGGLAYINHDCGFHLNGIIDLALKIGNFYKECLAATDPNCISAGGDAVKGIVNADIWGCSNPTLSLPGFVGGTQTLTMSSDFKSFKVSGEPGWGVGSDGDRGNNSGFGFYHQELVAGAGGVTDLSKSRLFALPAGTACGFHHTQNTPANATLGMGTCMGLDPALGQCPSGWNLKYHFDMQSGDGTTDCNNPANLNSPHCGYFVWCEYQDPNNFCPNGSACEWDAINKGYAVGVASSTYASGADYYGQYCPAGSYRSSYYDDGMSAGQGVSSCTH
jgi:hypothetical protein